MKNILEAPFLVEMVRTTTNMYNHGWDETFGLIETAEKAAEIYMKIAHLPLVNTITDDQMHQLEAHFGVKARDGFLS